MTREKLSFTIADVREMAKRFSNWDGGATTTNSER